MNLNLEQIRAATALAYARNGANTRNTHGGEVVRKLPALIMGNGLLAAAAFAFQKEHDDYPKALTKFRTRQQRGPNTDEEKLLHNGFFVCFNFLTCHLADQRVGIIPRACDSLDALLKHLTTEADSQTLKMATDEALAWLTYARRFVVKSNGSEVAESNGGDDDSVD